VATEIFPAQKTALAFIEVILPPGEIIADVNPGALLSSIARTLGRAPGLALILFIGLWLLELRCFLSTGKLYRSLRLKQRLQLHQNWLHKKPTSFYLRILSLPFKLSYTLNDTTVTQVRAHNDIQANRIQAITPTQERWQSNLAKASELESNNEIEADVVIIGTGAGGAPAAYELASRGLAVVLIEEGRYYQRADFNGSVFEMMQKLYRNFGATGTLGNAVIAMPLGKNVGGTTTINSGTCMRTPSEVLETWRSQGLESLTDEEMKPYFNAVEYHLKVQPANEKYVGTIGDVVKKGANAMGYSQHGPLKRNAEGCEGLGLCQFGCPSGAKQSTNVSYIPMALRNGAMLYSEFKAKRLLRKGNQVQGVVAYGKGRHGKPIKLIVRAQKTILSMGAVYTPDFLNYNGIHHPRLGKNLSIHPSGVITALYKQRNFNHSETIPQGYGVFDLASRGLVFEGGTPPFIVHSMVNPRLGKPYVAETEQFQHTAYLGFMIKDSSRGRVRSTPLLGFPILSYRMNKADFKLFLEGVRILAELHLNAGADALYVTGNPKYGPIHNHQELKQLLQQTLKPLDFLISAYHPLGTCGIAGSKKLGVCDSDHKVFGQENLYVMDGSSVPSALGVNPQITIMALATRAASHLADQLLNQSSQIETPIKQANQRGHAL